MTDDRVQTDEKDGELSSGSVGAELKRHRLAAGLDLNDIGARTRIPLRHLESIEDDAYAALPSPTYAIGFTKAYARALGLNEAPYVKRLRELLDRPLVVTPSATESPYAVESSHFPTKTLAWVAIALLLIIGGGYGALRAGWFGGTDTGQQMAQDFDPSADPILPPTAESGDHGPTPVAPPTDAAQNDAGGPVSAPASGTVVLTAKEATWLKVTDGKTRLYEGELAPGATFQLPADAQDPRLITGRPEMLTVTVGGQPVAPLGPPARTVRNVSLLPAALTANPGPSNPDTAAAAQTAGTPGPGTADMGAATQPGAR